ncbi:MAG: nuclear transport factor 2 family protein [Amphiplicatus sp.]
MSHILEGAMTETAQRFLTDWSAVVSSRDFARLPDLLAEDVELRTPLYWKPRQGRDTVARLIAGVGISFGAVHYERQWVSVDELALEFRTTIDDLDVKGIDLITLDETGRIKNIEVMLRPPNALAALRAKMEALLAAGAAG